MQTVFFRILEFFRRSEVYIASVIVYVFLWGCLIWKLACPELHSLEVAFNKVLHRIRNLPYRSHRALTHKTASLQSIYNLVYIRCGRLLQAAKLSPSVLVQHVFLSAALYPWCFLGYNILFGFRHVRSYRKSDYALAGLIIREIRNDYLCIPGIECSELEQLSVVKAWVGLTAVKIARAVRVCTQHRMLCNCGLLNTVTLMFTFA